MTSDLLILCIAILAGLYMAWTIGANDVANAVGTSVGSGAITLAAAVVLAGVFEFSGAVLIGSSVTETISKGIVEVSLFEPTGPLGSDGPKLLALGMLCALLGAALWLHLATYFGLPVSTSHSIVGAVVGVGVISFGIDGVQWDSMGQIAGSWVVSPLLGGILSYISFLAVRQLILRNPDPVGATRRFAPVICGIVVAIMTLSFIYKVLKNRVELPPVASATVAALLLGAVCTAIAWFLTRRAEPVRGANPYDYVERIFAYLQLGTACYVAFAHGANDVSNAIGPLATIVSLFQNGYSEVASSVGVPFWLLLLGGGGIVIGLATLGYKVIATIGKEITEITPTRGFSAEFGAATTVLVASALGLPISTTHTLVGGIIGVGFAQGMGALNLGMIRNIVNSWLATIPVSAAMTAILFLVARAVLL